MIKVFYLEARAPAKHRLALLYSYTRAIPLFFVGFIFPLISSKAGHKTGRKIPIEQKKS